MSVQDVNAETDPGTNSPRGTGFASVGFKGRVLHIQIAPHQDRFLRFAFEGTAYQYYVLPVRAGFSPTQPF